jgi:hypothetical protein
VAFAAWVTHMGDPVELEVFKNLPHQIEVVVERHVFDNLETEDHGEPAFYLGQIRIHVILRNRETPSL